MIAYNSTRTDSIEANANNKIENHNADMNHDEVLKEANDTMHTKYITAKVNLILPSSTIKKPFIESY